MAASIVALSTTGGFDWLKPYASTILTLFLVIFAFSLWLDFLRRFFRWLFRLIRKFFSDGDGNE